jgi:hypothetical protein
MDRTYRQRRAALTVTPNGRIDTGGRTAIEEPQAGTAGSQMGEV